MYTAYAYLTQAGEDAAKANNDDLITQINEKKKAIETKYKEVKTDLEKKPRDLDSIKCVAPDE